MKIITSHGELFSMGFRLTDSGETMRIYSDIEGFNYVVTHKFEVICGYKNGGK